MFDLDTRLCPNGSDVAAKILDGEAIIINLATGSYYSMDKAGAFLWEVIERQCSVEELSSALSTCYDVTEDQARADVQRLVAELVHENLVTVSAGERHSSPSPPPKSPSRLPYEPPRLNVFTDMRDLLALDPPPPALEDIPWKDPSGGSQNPNG